MRIENVAFAAIDWNGVEETVHPGAKGEARIKAWREGDLQVRMVRYSAGYEADHWCPKGHVVLGLEGALEIELRDGRTTLVTPGISVILADDGPGEAHMTRSRDGATLFIVD